MHVQVQMVCRCVQLYRCVQVCSVVQVCAGEQVCRATDAGVYENITNLSVLEIPVDLLGFVEEVEHL